MKKWVQISQGAPPTQPPLSLPQSLWQYLWSRGYKTENELEELFSPSLLGLTHPFALDQMDIAVERLIAALKNQEKICIYADFDMDGTPGLALLKRGLELCGFLEIIYFQPKRLIDGYGVHEYKIEEFKAQDVKLIVTVDVGITDVQAVARANELGIDVIITDHHLAKEQLPQALAIVNPNKPGDVSGLGHLCGAGVAFYLVLALKMKLKELGLLENDFSSKVLLDCFTIGTLTDMVPLIRENRVLVKHGLKAVQNTDRPGLKAMLKQLGLARKELQAGDIAIRLAPKLNALSRLEKDILPIDIFLAESDVQADQLVKNVMKNNNERVKLQERAELEAEKLFFDSRQQGFIWVSSEDFHQGVVGLVATKLSQKYNLPSFVGAMSSEGKITGSARLPKEYDGSLLDALDYSNAALVKFGGHAPAAGFELEVSKKEELESLLQEYYNQNKSTQTTEQILEYHAESCFSEVTHGFMRWLDQLGPFGEKFESPIFRLNRLVVQTHKVLKGGHIKFKLYPEQQKNILREGLWFSPPRERMNLYKEGDVVDLLGEPQWNYFNGSLSIQFLIKDIQLSEV